MYLLAEKYKPLDAVMFRVHTYYASIVGQSGGGRVGEAIAVSRAGLRM